MLKRSPLDAIKTHGAHGMLFAVSGGGVFDGGMITQMPCVRVALQNSVYSKLKARRNGGDSDAVSTDTAVLAAELRSRPLRSILTRLTRTGSSSQSSATGARKAADPRFKAANNQGDTSAFAR